MSLGIQIGCMYGDEKEKRCSSCQHIEIVGSDLFGESASCAIGGDSFEHYAESEPNCPKWEKCKETFNSKEEYCKLNLQ